jgi:hypothetical protein
MGKRKIRPGRGGERGRRTRIRRWSATECSAPLLTCARSCFRSGRRFDRPRPRFAHKWGGSPRASRDSSEDAASRLMDVRHEPVVEIPGRGTLPAPPRNVARDGTAAKTDRRVPARGGLAARVERAEHALNDLRAWGAPRVCPLKGSYQPARAAGLGGEHFEISVHRERQGGCPRPLGGHPRPCRHRYRPGGSRQRSEFQEGHAVPRRVRSSQSRVQGSSWSGHPRTIPTLQPWKALPMNVLAPM